MSNTQNISAILANNTAPLALPLTCESCGGRTAYAGRKWCRPCILAWQRQDLGRAAQTAGTIPDTFTERLRLVHDEEFIPKRYETATIQDLPNPLREAAEQLADDQGLYLWGPPGTGKTYSLCAIMRWLYYGGWDILRVTWEMLCLKVRDSYKNKSKSELDVIWPYLYIDKLIIEDIGTAISFDEQESDFSLRILLLIFDTRIETCRATFFSSNKSIEEISKAFDSRVASRIQLACRVIKLDGRDKRFQTPGGCK